MSLEFILAQIKREEEDAYHTLVKKGRHREIRQYELGYSRNKRFVYVGDVETQPKQFQIPVYFLSVEYNVYATDQELSIQINQPLQKNPLRKEISTNVTRLTKHPSY